MLLQVLCFCLLERCSKASRVHKIVIPFTQVGKDETRRAYVMAQSLIKQKVLLFHPPTIMMSPWGHNS
jgi:hypothetical protein